jgi:hypothetical protein
MKAKSHPKNWWIDAALFTGFVVTFLLDLTGVSFHQWLGVAVSVLAGYHLLAHWKWVSVVAERLRRNSWQARFYFTLDAGIFIFLLGILITGLAISTWLGLSLNGYEAWRDAHVGISLAALALIAVKIVVHWRWIVSVARRWIFRPYPTRVEPHPLQPAAARPDGVHLNKDRRDFLKLAGIVGAASFVSLAGALDIPSSLVSSNSGDDSAAATSSQAEPAQNSVQSSASASTCTVQCNRRCSYPGHCRRYTDSNGNNRCDFGECA